MPKALIEVHSPIGRSDPQAVYMANSLSRMGWEVRLIQCLHSETEYVIPEGYISRDVELLSYVPIMPMWAKSAIIEFAIACSQLLREWAPDVFIAYDFAGQLCISHANAACASRIATKTIVMQLETVSYTSRFFDGDCMGIIADAWKSSLVVYPEPNRLLIDAKKMSECAAVPLGFDILSPTVPHLLGSQFLPRVLDASSKIDNKQECKIVYAGSVVEESYVIDALTAIGKIGLSSGLAISLSVAGPIGASVKECFLSLIEAIPFARYLGVLNQQQVQELVQDAHFSFIGWKPIDENFYYCAPNKFFQALALGAVPICVPSPIFLRALEGLNGLDFPCLDWNTALWENQLPSLLRYYLGRHQDVSSKNEQVFRDRMSWDVEFARFYKRNLSHDAVD